MVSFEPSVSDSLAHPLEEFAKGLGNLLKPNQAFQQGMQKAIGANPQLAQDLADLEYNAPGTLQKMGFGDLGHILSRVPESEKNQFNRQNRGEIMDVQKQKLGLEGKETGFNLERLNATIDALRNDPTLSADMIHKKLTGLTIDEAKGVPIRNKLLEAEVEHVNAEADIERATHPIRLAQAKREKDLQDTLDAHPELNAYDPIDIVRKMMRGIETPYFREYLKLPGGNEAISHAQGILNAQAQRDAIQANRALVDRSVRDEERAKISAARALQVQSKGASTLAAFRSILETPELIDEINAKVTAGTPLTQEEKNVVAANEAQQEMVDKVQDQERYKNVFAMRQAELSTRNAIKSGASQADINLNVNGLNQVLTSGLDKGAEKFRAIYGPVPDVGSSKADEHTARHPFTGSPPGLYYVNEEGRRVPDDVPFTPNKTGLTSDELRALTLVQASKDRKAALAALFKEDSTVARKVETFLNKKK